MNIAKHTASVKHFTILASLLLAAAVTASCGSETAPAGKNDTTAVERETAASETEELIKPDLPEKDYGGAVFTTFVRKSDQYALDLHVDEMDGDTMNDAVFQRNSRVSEQFNVTLAFHRGTDDFGSGAKTVVLANDPSYDVLMIHGRFVFPYALEGLLLDWNTELPHINLDNPWWTADARQAFSLCNCLFAMNGDLSYGNLGSTKCMVFNKKICSELDIPFPYQDVIDGKWTFDRFSELVKTCSADLNGDSTLDIEHDRYGYATWQWSGPIQVLYSANQRISKKDKDDLMYISLNTETTVNLFNDYFTMTDGPECYISLSDAGDEPVAAFREGRALFYDPNVNQIMNLRDMQDDFGIIPWPKYTEDVDGYYANVDAGCNLFCVPVSNADPERASIVLEALAYEGSRTVIPTYYDVVLSSKYSRDEESAKMLDIICAGRVFDIGYYFYADSNDLNSIGWYMAHDTTHNFASLYAKYEKTVLKQYEKVNQTFQGLN